MTFGDRHACAEFTGPSFGGDRPPLDQHYGGDGTGLELGMESLALATKRGDCLASLAVNGAILLVQLGYEYPSIPRGRSKVFG